MPGRLALAGCGKQHPDVLQKDELPDQITSRARYPAYIPSCKHPCGYGSRDTLAVAGIGYPGSFRGIS